MKTLSQVLPGDKIYIIYDDNIFEEEVTGVMDDESKGVYKRKITTDSDFYFVNPELVSSRGYDESVVCSDAESLYYTVLATVNGLHSQADMLMKNMQQYVGKKSD